ncbi:Chitin synthase, class 1 [Physocladia obscura]|uniref:Chitin synthase n=1 Tax=Physocladia obscura TaxID=109957 RepID=A0AAD5XIB5_9FUNG|nr:Chitin synthase, class 1 [Physocladia obscura]
MSLATFFESWTPLFSTPPIDANLFRHKTVKTVELPASGNYVVDIPVPERVLAAARDARFSKKKSKTFGAVETRAAATSADTIVEINCPIETLRPRVNPAVEIPNTNHVFSHKDENGFWKTLFRDVTSTFLGTKMESNKPEIINDKTEVEADMPTNFVTPSIVDDSREFTHLRYTAATCDPNDFANKGFSLRAQELDRKTEIFIVITMYNEDEHSFTKTWKSVARNIAYLCTKRRGPAVWGPDAWKKVVVCVVADGRAKIHPRTLTVLGIMGAYQEGIIKTSVNGNPTTAHIFEYTTQVLVEPNNGQSVKGPREFKTFGGCNLPPIQIIFCLKETNAKKINSHRWFFNGFGKLLKPEVCILLDVGTKPTDRTFNQNPNVGGACGEIYAELGLGWTKLFNPLVAAQNFEYKISNILDKPFESCFGFISVLPGAFSAYRFKALQNDINGVGPLEKYFMGETLHHGGDISKANMYLTADLSKKAEDRILCFELVSKRGASWILKYVRNAKAETDVPDSVPVNGVDG